MSALPRNWTSAVDRRPFIPDLVWVYDRDNASYHPLWRSEEPQAWEDLVASDEAVITQLAPEMYGDGISRPFWPTSSSSSPDAMNAMLDALDLQPGMSVLEIGAGTGWNAAVMAAAGAIVTSIEIDPDLADHARAALARAGFPCVVVVTGDGELGAPEQAPFDRLIATAAAHAIPYEWVRQCRDGARMVIPCAGPRYPYGLAVLTVRGGVAKGPIVSEHFAFMMLRGQRLTPPERRKLGDAEPGLVLQVGPNGQRATRAKTTSS